jgi:hypothetical protein
MISEEVQRKALQAQLGGDTLTRFMEAIGLGVPDNMKVIPGFEPGGIAERLGQMSGTNVKETVGAAQDIQRQAVPFSQIAQMINDIPGPEQLGDKYRAMAESYFPQMQPIMPDMSLVGWSGGGGGGGYGGGVSPGIGEAMSSVLNEYSAPTPTGNATGIQGPPNPNAKPLAQKGVFNYPAFSTEGDIHGPPVPKPNSGDNFSQAEIAAAEKAWKNRTPTGEVNVNGYVLPAKAGGNKSEFIRSYILARRKPRPEKKTPRGEIY